MKIVFFYQSMVSCWNNGHAHFLRGLVRELIKLGHQVEVFEPEHGWSRLNAIKDGGTAVFRETEQLIPGLRVQTYRDDEIDLDYATDRADLIVIQEWSSPTLVAALGRHRVAGGRYLLMFHDSHHRSITAPAEIESFELDGYDGVLAFGETVRESYIQRGWARRAFTFHEAADTALFRPLPSEHKDADLIWIGNWGDEERSHELRTFLINPAVKLGLRTRIHGVRYPQSVEEELKALRIDYAGWLPNHQAPRAYARARVTVHVPRAPYRQLPGVPTIRVFEALACGIPLVCAPWQDAEKLFPEGAYLTAADEAAMCAGLSKILHDDDAARSLIKTGLGSIKTRHSCAHRVRQLLSIAAEIRGSEIPPDRPAPPEIHQVRP